MPLSKPLRSPSRAVCSDPSFNTTTRGAILYINCPVVQRLLLWFLKIKMHATLHIKYSEMNAPFKWA